MLKACSLPGFGDTEESETESDSEEYASETLTEVNVNSLMLNLAVSLTMCLAFAHMLQFSSKDGFKQAGNITKVLIKALLIVSYVKESTIEVYFLESGKC